MAADSLSLRQTAGLVVLGVMLGLGGWSALRTLRRPPSIEAAPVGEAPPVPALAGPVKVQVGELAVWVSRHPMVGSAPPVEAYAFRTEGLAAVGQPELLFLLREQRGEDAGVVAQSLEPLLAARLAAGKAGEVLGPGAVVELPAAGVFGHPEFRGLLTIPAPAIEGLTLPAGTLGAVLVTEGELAVAQNFGPGRILARLGDQAKFYPTPPWSDRGRAAVVGTPAEEAGSVLEQVPHGQLPGVSIRREGGSTAVLTLPAEAAGHLDAVLAALGQGGFGFLGLPGPLWDAQLVWMPGAAEARAITPDGSAGAVVGANFLLLSRGKAASHLVTVEDGLGVLLQDADYDKIVGALTRGAPAEVSGPGGVILRLEWVRSTWTNPVDGSTVAVAGGFRTNAGQQPAPTGAVALRRVLLLTPEREAGERIAVDALAAYIGAVRGQVEGQLGGRPAGSTGELLLQCVLRPGAPAEWKALGAPALEGSVEGALLGAISGLAAPEVKGELRFLLDVALWGGDPKAFDLPN